MTFQWYNILAADDDGLINILVLVVMGVIALVGHLIKKAQEKRQVEEADRKVEEAKRRHAAEKYAPEETKPPPAPPRPSVPAAGVKQQAQVIHAATALGQGTSQEVIQMREQLAAKEMRQRKRLASTKHLQPKIGGKAVRAESVSSDGPKIHLNLTSPKAAKTAIICAEILGPPKALRADPEPWDM